MTLSALVLLLGVIVVLSNFTDFLIGASGQKKLRERLAEFYVRADDVNWSGLLGMAFRLTDKYLSHIFGSRLLSWRFVIVGSAISFFASVAVTLLWLIWARDPRWTFQGEWDSLWHTHIGGNYLITFSINCLIDLVAFLIIRYWVRKTSIDPSAKAVLGLIVGSVFIGYMCICLAAALALPFVRLRVAWQLEDHALQEWASKWLEMAPLIFRHALAHPFNSATMWGAPPHEHNFSLFLLTSAFGTWVQFVILSLTYLAWLSARFLKYPLLLVTRRLEESPKGLFTLLGLLVSAIIGVLTAYGKVVSP